MDLGAPVLDVAVAVSKSEPDPPAEDGTTTDSTEEEETESIITGGEITANDYSNKTCTEYEH